VNEKHDGSKPRQMSSRRRKKSGEGTQSDELKLLALLAPPHLPSLVPRGYLRSVQERRTVAMAHIQRLEY